MKHIILNRYTGETKMKIFFTILAIITILALVLAGCETEEENKKEEDEETTLTINNVSFTELTDVIWQNVSFRNNQYENSIKIGTNVTAAVQAGTGYIFFKRRSNPIIARTNEIILIEKYQQKEFIFTDNTVIVEVNNPNNNGTLGSIQSTVVWFDDAEGEMQPYHLRQTVAGYYSSYDVMSNDRSFYPKNGWYSIRIGGTNTALLHLKLNLTHNARLSFWYANRFGDNDGAIFSINDVQKAKWTNDVDWSFIMFDLPTGENNLIWEKKDGRGAGAYSNYSYFLSLDDILIYYTE